MIKILGFALGLSFGFTAAPASAFDFNSSIPGVQSKNVHWVRHSKILRGAAPTRLGNVRELIELGVTDVVIFKNQTTTEVDDEIYEWRTRGVRESRIHHIPMPWHELSSQEDACRMVIEALQVIRRVELTRSRKVFFHCTMGEDRTGLLAGLIRYLSQGWDSEQAFRDEMCAHGYEAGDPAKIRPVYSDVRRDLTPLYLKLVDRAAAGRFRWDTLNADVACAGIDQDPVDAAGWVCSSR